MSRLELLDTVELMGSSDYRDRFVAEYIQTKIRYERLKAFNTKIEAAVRTAGQDNGVDEPLHNCPAGLLREQQAAMGEYLHLLEVRAVIEDIDLSDAELYLKDKKLRERCKYAENECKNTAEEGNRVTVSLPEDDDWDIVEEAIRRVLEKGLFDDEGEEKLMAAGLNVLHKIKLLEEPCRDVKKDDSKEKICSDCVHLPICEYCNEFLDGFMLPTKSNECGMHLSEKSVKIEDADLSPEEIKKGLEYCVKGDDCLKCPVYKKTNGSNCCSDILMKSAHRYIVKLEEKCQIAKENDKNSSLFTLNSSLEPSALEERKEGES